MSTGSTPNYNIPYPLSTDPVNVAGDIQQLAEKIDLDLTESIQDVSSTMWTTGGTFNNGLQAPTYNDTTGKMSMSLSQDLRTSASPTFVGTTLTGDIAVNGGDITTTAITFNLINTTATTLNLGQAATVINVGNASGQTNFAGHVNVATGKEYEINNVSILSATTLGSSVVNSSLTSVGTISTGTWNATTIAVNRGGTGVTTSTGTGSVVLSASPSFTGTPSTTATGGIFFDFKAGGTSDHGYLRFYIDTDNPTIRSGYYGWGSAGVTVLTIANEMTNGNINIITNGTGVVQANGSELAKLVSPTFTTPNIGVATGTSFNSITGLSSTSPSMNGSAFVGLGTTAARGDHVHPTDTTRAPLASPIFTGVVSSQGTQILMNSDVTGAPTENITLSVERGTSPDVAIRWNESTDVWEFTNDGTTYQSIGSGGGGGVDLSEVYSAAMFVAGM